MPIRSRVTRRTRALSFCLVLLTGLIAASTLELSARGQTTALPLAQQGDLVYLGAFRLPSGPTDQTSFEYGGTALAFNPQRGTLFIVGHDWYQRVAEITIPAVSNGSTISSLSTAAIVQPLTDILRGRSCDVGGCAKIGGLLPYGNQLVVSAYIYYDGNGSQSLSHFVTSADESSTAAPAGPYVVSNQLGLAGFVSGYMTPIPAEWQSALGGPYLTGQCCLPIVGRTSFGPSATVFNPTTLGPAPAPGKTVLGYPIGFPMIGDWSSSGTLFNGSTEMGGVVFPPGTRSVLFFGRLGTGPFCYGEGTGTKSLAGTINPADGGTFCYDPVDGAKGTHSYPYVHYVWAYDANDLVRVKQGVTQPWALRPYATWTLDTPFETGSRIISGVAYDPATQRVFISAAYEDGAQPLIQVFKLNAGSGAPYINPVTPLNPGPSNPAPRDPTPGDPTRTTLPGSKGILGRLPTCPHGQPSGPGCTGPASSSTTSGGTIIR